MTVELKITGLEEIQAKLKRLPIDVQKKGARFAGRKAADIFKQAAIVNAKGIDDKKTANDIAKNIAVRFSPATYRATGNLVFRVGVLGGAKTKKKDKKSATSSNPGGDTFYWRFIEFGTSKIKAKPFLRPVLTQKSQDAINEFGDQFNSWLDKQLKKGN